MVNRAVRGHAKAIKRKRKRARLRSAGVDLITAWVSGALPISDRAARYIERRLGLPDGWMDAEHGDASPQLHR